jgi:short-subunit dehydrogenase
MKLIKKRHRKFTELTLKDIESYFTLGIKGRFVCSTQANKTIIDKNTGNIIEYVSLVDKDGNYVAYIDGISLKELARVFI